MNNELEALRSRNPGVEILFHGLLPALRHRRRAARRAQGHPEKAQ